MPHHPSPSRPRRPPSGGFLGALAGLVLFLFIPSNCAHDPEVVIGYALILPGLGAVVAVMVGFALRRTT